MRQNNILKAITTAILHLERSMEAISEKNESKVGHFTWHAASDIEYALFLFSLMHQNETISSSWKLNKPTKQVEIEALLALVLDLLKEAKESFGVGEMLGAYKNTWMARGYLLRVHDFIEKKRRNLKKTSSS